ncbi:hypothetical protein [Paeniglutamicibacter terrestris]|uniref:Secreted protein n=1 Tax=Paeniglutamicibacter terrestris TaxID=2723403 RepID=A0ABX1G8I6_9MICC|nr:hypothetical protein [Paeniglutamicibacter terrestris]NKG22021.1 hypothetical protein [Paeniglutamicibacter terrestris]
MPVVAAFGLQPSDFLMLQLHREPLLRFVASLVASLAIAFSCGRKCSLINPHNPRHNNDVVLPHTESQKPAAIKTAVYVAKTKVTVPGSER